MTIDIDNKFLAYLRQKPKLVETLISEIVNSELQNESSDNIALLESLSELLLIRGLHNSSIDFQKIWNAVEQLLNGSHGLTLQVTERSLLPVIQSCAKTIPRAAAVAAIQTLFLHLTAKNDPETQSIEKQNVLCSILICIMGCVDDDALVSDGLEQFIAIIDSNFTNTAHFVPYFRKFLNIALVSNPANLSRYQDLVAQLLKAHFVRSEAHCLKLVAVCFDELLSAAVSDEKRMAISKPHFINSDFEELELDSGKKTTRKRHQKKPNESAVREHEFPDSLPATVNRNCEAFLRLLEQPFFAKLIQNGLQSRESSSNKYALFILKRIVDYQVVQKWTNAASFTVAGTTPKTFEAIWSDWFVLYEVMNEKTGHLVEQMLGPLHRFPLQQMDSTWFVVLLRTGLSVDMLQVRKLILEFIMGLDSDKLAYISQTRRSFWLDTFYKECLHISHYGMNGSGNYTSEFGGQLSLFTAKLVAIEPSISADLVRFVCGSSSQLCAIFVLEGLSRVSVSKCWGNSELQALCDFLSNSNILLQTSHDIVQSYICFILQALLKNLDFSRVELVVFCMAVGKLLSKARSYVEYKRVSRLLLEYSLFDQHLQLAGEQMLLPADLFGEMLAAWHIATDAAEWSLPPNVLNALSRAKVCDRYLNHELMAQHLLTFQVVQSRAYQFPETRFTGIKQLTRSYDDIAAYLLFESRAACLDCNWNLVNQYMALLELLHVTHTVSDANSLVHAQVYDSVENPVGQLLVTLRNMWLICILSEVAPERSPHPNVYIPWAITRWKSSFTEWLPDSSEYVDTSEWGSAVIARFTAFKWKSVSLSVSHFPMRDVDMWQVYFESLIAEIAVSTTDNECQLLQSFSQLLETLAVDLKGALSREFLDKSREWLMELLKAQSLQEARSKQSKRVIQQLSNIAVLLSLVCSRQDYTECGHNFMLPAMVFITEIGQTKSDVCPSLCKQLLERFCSWQDYKWLRSVLPVVTTLLYWGPRRSASELKASVILEDVKWHQNSTAENEAERRATVGTAERNGFYQEYLARVYMTNLLYQFGALPAAASVARELALMLMERYEEIPHEREGVTNTLGHHYHLRIWIALTHILDIVDRDQLTGFANRLMAYLRKEPVFSTRLYIEWALARCVSFDPASCLSLLVSSINDVESIGKGTASLVTVVNHLLTVLDDRWARVLVRDVAPAIFAAGLAKQFTCRTFAQFVSHNIIQKAHVLEYTLPNELAPLAQFIENHKDSVNGREKYDNMYLLTQFHIFNDLNVEFIHRGMLDIGLVISDEFISPFAFEKVNRAFPPVRQMELRGSRTREEACWGKLPLKPSDLADTSSLTVSAEDGSSDENLNCTSVVQKKLIPWQVMLHEDVDLSRLSMLENTNVRKRTELLVVASLVQRPPNLGGLCRTCEIFNASKLIVHDAAIKRNPTFLSLAVTADKWLPIEQVAEADLIKYLLWCKEKLGYSVVGLEQTSNSQPLETFKFPEKTCLVLGKEREGIPAPILSLLDHVIEIKQYGLIRSLNVHVSGALVIHEYSKQFNN